MKLNRKEAKRVLRQPVAGGTASACVPPTKGSGDFTLIPRFVLMVFGDGVFTK